MKNGILLVNLGTPDSPDPKDVKRYLLEFLTDGRVIDSPWLLRQFLVRGIIVPRRYKESAKQYKGIWTERGSPLKFHTEDLAKNLLASGVQAEVAMRYQNPSIESALEKLKNCDAITIVPLFPQYASATTGSIFQKVCEIIQKWEQFPTLTFIDSFADHPAFIEAQAKLFPPQDDYDHIILSYHGLPKRQNDRCNRYYQDCEKTTKALAEKLGLKNYTMTFQSRLGKAEWIKPYTSDVIEDLAKKGAKKILVATPAFVADCLETIFEIGEEYAELFQSFGGEILDRVPCVNGQSEWLIDSVITSHMGP